MQLISNELLVILVRIAFHRMKLKENQAKYWSRARVITYLMGNLLKPARIKGDLTELFRTAKRRAANLPCKSLVDIFPKIDQCEVKVRYWAQLGGGSIADIVALAQVARFLDSRHMFEIGTFRGYTTYHLALNTAIDARVYTLDLPASGIQAAKLEITDVSLINKPFSGEWFLGTPVESKITQLLGDSASFDYSPYEGQMDFVYVDGAHSYEYAMSDSLTARRLIAPNGVILWHDYPTWPGVWACLEDLSRQWPGHFSWIEGTALVVWQQ
jgi:hypothetical protein